MSCVRKLSVQTRGRFSVSVSRLFRGVEQAEIIELTTVDHLIIAPVHLASTNLSKQTPLVSAFVAAVVSITGILRVGGEPQIVNPHVGSFAMPM